MTLCVACLNIDHGNKRLIVLCDRKVTFWGGMFSGEGMMLKISAIHSSWSVMFAGDNSTLVPLVDAVKASVRRSKANTLREFARLCSAVYRDERKRIIETEVLGKYDVKSYQEYLALRRDNGVFYEELSQQIREIEENWHLLFFGYDKKGEPHIFLITEYGKIQFCDFEGVAVIGSGAWAALTALASLQYSSERDLGECIYRLLVSKFTAEESADGVGQETLVCVLDGKHKMSASWTISEEDVTAIRNEWKTRCTVPKDAVDKVRNCLYRVAQPAEITEL